MSGGIMQRPPRPEPTRISPYFFEQLQFLSHENNKDRHNDENLGESSTVHSFAGEQPTNGSIIEGRVQTNCISTAAAAAEEQESKEQTSASIPSVPTNLARLFDDDPAGPHRDGAGLPVPIFASPQLHDLQQVLWTSFTPEPYTADFSNFLRSESDVTERLRRAVAEAWTSVEKIMQRNSNRRACLDTLTAEDAAWRGEVQSKLYWQSADIVARYGLEVGGPSGPATTAESATTAEGRQRASHPNGDMTNTNNVNNNNNNDEYIVLDFSVLQESHVGSGVQRNTRSANSRRSKEEDDDEDGEEEGCTASISDSRDAATRSRTVLNNDAAMHPQHAKPWSTSTEELLDPCARPHPLRRLFAPLQRQRANLPKWTTLLLSDVGQVQRTQLPDLEARMRNSVLFKVPLHRLFLEARAVLQACVSQRRAAPEVETSQVATYRQVEQLGNRFTTFIQGQQQQQQSSTTQENKVNNAGSYSTLPSSLNNAGCSSGGNADQRNARAVNEDDDLITDMGERWATAETLWTMLLTELDTCKRFLSDAVPRCKKLHDTVESERAYVRGALEQHRATCEEKLSRMKTEARTCAELLKRNGLRTLAAVAEMEDNYSPDHDRLVSAIARRKAELKQLEAQQEKSVRRVREALKACFLDQMKYEEAAQALLQDQLSLVQLEASHQQLRQAVQVRHEGAIENEKHAAQLMQLLEDSDTVAHALFTACDAHIRRIADEDYYIQCRLVDQCTSVLQQRCRCLHAIAALYDQRHTKLEDRAGGKWQLQFLLSGERDWAVANLADVRTEFVLLERDWEKVRAMRTGMDMDTAELDALIKVPEWASLESTLLCLDAPAVLQRRLPTLRVHAETLTHPAAGCGSQAVRRLLTS